MRYLEPVIIVLVALLVTLGIFLVGQSWALHRAAVVAGDQMWVQMLLKNHAPLPVADADIIRPWMTFDYVNRLFGIAPNYLQQKFSINDTHYPKITLSGFAKEEKEPSSMVVSQIVTAIQTYGTSTAQ